MYLKKPLIRFSSIAKESSNIPAPRAIAAHFPGFGSVPTTPLMSFHPKVTYKMRYSALFMIFILLPSAVSAGPMQTAEGFPKLKPVLDDTDLSSEGRFETSIVNGAGEDIHVNEIRLIDYPEGKDEVECSVILDKDVKINSAFPVVVDGCKKRDNSDIYSFLVEIDYIRTSPDAVSQTDGGMIRGPVDIQSARTRHRINRDIGIAINLFSLPLAIIIISVGSYPLIGIPLLSLMTYLIHTRAKREFKVKLTKYGGIYVLISLILWIIAFEFGMFNM